MGVKDVGVEELGGVRRHRAGNPRDIPDTELPVLRVDPSAAAQLECQRVGHGDRGHDGQHDDQGPFTATCHAARIVARA